MNDNGEKWIEDIRIIMILLIGLLLVLGLCVVLINEEPDHCVWKQIESAIYECK